MAGDSAFVERDQQLAQLDGALADVCVGRGRVVLVCGEAGAGKSSLVSQFASDRASRRGVDVLTGLCDPFPSRAALGPLFDIGVALDVPPEQLRSAPSSPHDLFLDVYARLAALRRPVAVVVEDVHWADQATLDLVAFLGRRVQRLPLLLILTFRSDELRAADPLGVTLGNLATTPGLVRIDLEPLSRTAVASLARGTGIDAGELHRRTGGNPFFVSEVLRNPEAAVPPTVRDAILARISRLSPEAQQTIQAAAVIGARMESDLLVHVMLKAGIPRWSLQELISSGVLRQEDARLFFRHELVESAIYDSIPPSGRQRLHVLALEELETAGGADYARLTRHAEASGNDAAVLHFAPLAAAQAAGFGAHRQAASLLSLAIERARYDRQRTAELLEQRGTQHYLALEFGGAAEDHRAAADAWHGLGNTLNQARNLIRLSYVRLADGDRDESDAVLQTATGLLEHCAPSQELAMAYEAWA
ncbi:MAG: AAA family ATPase, partial [Chloroflexi bacterium]|nr:AAA family ATPase [Chloroflexota bacterium]